MTAGSEVAGEQRDGRRAGRGDQVQHADVVADRQRRAGPERGDLGEVGAAGEVPRPRRLALDRVRERRSRCSAPMTTMSKPASCMRLAKLGRTARSASAAAAGRPPPGASSTSGRWPPATVIERGWALRARIQEMSGGGGRQRPGRRVGPDAGVLQLLGLALQRVHLRRAGGCGGAGRRRAPCPTTPARNGRSAWKIRLVRGVVLQVVDPVVVGARAAAQDQRRPGRRVLAGRRRSRRR